MGPTRRLIIVALLATGAAELLQVQPLAALFAGFFFAAFGIGFYQLMPIARRQVPFLGIAEDLCLMLALSSGALGLLFMRLAVELYLLYGR